MAKIDMTPIEEMHRHLVQENQRLTEELAKVREVNEAQGNALAAVKKLLAECSGENEALREQLRQAQQRRTFGGSGEWQYAARSGK